MATGDRPASSSLDRTILRPNGFGDELRAVLRLDGRVWALFSLVRELGRQPSAPRRARVAGLTSGYAKLPRPT